MTLEDIADISQVIGYFQGLLDHQFEEDGKSGFRNALVTLVRIRGKMIKEYKEAQQ